MTRPDPNARSRGLQLVAAVDPPPEVDGTVIDDDWTRDLPRNKTGELKNTFAVVCAILRQDPEYRGTFWYDELWLEPRRGEHVFDDDYEYLKLRERIELRYNLGTIAEAHAYQAVYLVAKEKPRHPVKEYLNSLVWDGVPRLGTWLKEYLGAQGDDEYLSKVGTWTLQGAVARIDEPGCQVDYVMVLEGDQGLQKSSMLRSLVPNQDWVAAHQADLSTKDAYQVLDGKWLLELDELDRLSKQDLGVIKAFVTQRSDHYRRTWAKKARTYPRQSMFIATCNCAEYLHDPTGNRRWWPVTVTWIDAEGIAAIRDQLWAEAVHRHRENERRWPTFEEEKELFRPEQEQRRQQHPWEESIGRWLDAPDQKQEEEFTAFEILTGSLKIPIADQDDKVRATLGRVMKALGWTKGETRKRSDEKKRDPSGKKQRVYVYRRPEPALDPKTPPQLEPAPCETCGGHIDGYGVCSECGAGAAP